MFYREEIEPRIARISRILTRKSDPCYPSNPWFYFAVSFLAFGAGGNAQLAAVSRVAGSCHVQSLCDLRLRMMLM
jgi:hypothetical protein